MTTDANAAYGQQPNAKVPSRIEAAYSIKPLIALKQTKAVQSTINPSK